METIIANTTKSNTIEIDKVVFCDRKIYAAERDGKISILISLERKYYFSELNLGISTYDGVVFSNPHDAIQHALDVKCRVGIFDNQCDLKEWTN